MAAILKIYFCLLPNFKSIGLSVQKNKRKVDFQDGHLGFPLGTILVTFYLHVTAMLPTKFQVNWHFCSGEEAKNKFSRWSSWISDRNDLAISYLQVTDASF